jgi:hypothetical protein
MGLLDPILSFLLGPIDPPPADPLLAAGGVVARRMAHLERCQRHQMTRMVYLASMLHVGRHGTPIFPDGFEASTYGPIVPRLFDDLGRYAPHSLLPIHHRALPATALACLDEVCDVFEDVAGVRILMESQIKDGAWYRLYSPLRGMPTHRGLPISTADMMAEYQLRNDQPALAA